MILSRRVSLLLMLTSIFKMLWQRRRRLLLLLMGWRWKVLWWSRKGIGGVREVRRRGVLRRGRRRKWRLRVVRGCS